MTQLSRQTRRNRPRRIASLALGAALVVPPVMAQQADDATPGMAEMMPVLIRAELVEDSLIYSLDGAYDAEFWNTGEPFGAIAAEWTQIGEVEDVILGADGRVVGVSVDIGGFLGIGQNEVLLPFDDIRLVQRPEEDAFFIVTRLSAEQLEEREEIETVFED